MQGGCGTTTKIAGATVSNYNLEQLTNVDEVNQRLSLEECKSCMHIGGGFGANFHITTHNFPELNNLSGHRTKSLHCNGVLVKFLWEICMRLFDRENNILI